MGQQMMMGVPVNPEIPAGVRECIAQMLFRLDERYPLAWGEYQQALHERFRENAAAAIREALAWRSPTGEPWIYTADELHVRMDRAMRGYNQAVSELETERDELEDKDEWWRDMVLGHAALIDAHFLIPHDVSAEDRLHQIRNEITDLLGSWEEWESDNKRLWDRAECAEARCGTLTEALHEATALVVSLGNLLAAAVATGTGTPTPEAQYEPVGIRWKDIGAVTYQYVDEAFGAHRPGSIVETVYRRVVSPIPEQHATPEGEFVEEADWMATEEGT